jgi:hypothetical protein
MHFSLLFSISLGLLLIIQVNYSIDASQYVYTFQTNKTNSSGVMPKTGQDVQDEDNRTSIFNQPDGSRADPSDLGIKGNSLTPELIAKDLSQKNSSQIAEFPLQEYSKDDIIVVFDNLSLDALEKVLNSIHQENLKIIFDKFLPFEYESILEKVSQQTQDYVIKILGIQE